MGTFLCLIALALGEALPDAQPNANAAADPYYLHYGLGYRYGLGLHGLGYGYGYGYLGRKRRSADAEPVPDAEPAADPYLLYGHGYYGIGGYYPYYYGARYYYGR